MLDKKTMFLAVVLLLAMPISVLAQDQNVSGTVTDAETGESLPGVNIVLKGTTQGTTTDLEGGYRITSISPSDTLVYSYVGYESTEVAVNGRTEINVELNALTLMGDELIVVGYGTQRRMDLTGSIASIDTESMQSRSIISLEEGLQGQVSGVYVNQGSGQPGGRTFIRIRGQNSILGSSDPLYILDGVPIQSGSDGNTSLLASINPDDIESMQILKDASATAIYGARGSNGVVLITTKRGRAGQQNINFESSVGVSNVINKIDMMGSEEFVEIANERAMNDNANIPYPNPSAVTNINTDWQDEVFQTAITQNYSLSFAGGNQQTQYYTSGSYLDQEGSIIGSKFSRGSFRLNLDQEVGQNLRLSSQLIASQTVSDRSNTESLGGILRSALGGAPIVSPTDANGDFTPGVVFQEHIDEDDDNPLLIANERLNQLTTSRFIGNVRARYDIRSDFTADLMLGTDRSSSKLDAYSTRLLYSVPDGSGSERRSEATSYVIENMYTYNNSFSGGDHRVNAVAGFTWESETSNFLSASAEGFVTDDFSNNNLGAGERFSAPNNGLTEWDLLSFLGRINYSLNDRYLFTVSARRDGSSRFGEDNKWAFFPSFALAWRLDDYAFAKEVEQLSTLKLRFSWGKTGNQAISPYQSLQAFTPQTLVIGGSNAIGFAPNNLGNPNLKWETTEQINAGLDIGLWDERLRLSLDLYQKTTEDLLAIVNLPPSSGFSSTLQNIGSIDNRGIEIQIGTDIIRKINYEWSLDFNVSANRNKIEELSQGADIIAPSISFVGSANILREGEPISSFYGYVEDGLTDEGLIKYKDLNNDGTVDANDRTILGSPHPDLIYGLSSRFKYRNFDLNIAIQGELGKDLFNTNLYYHATSFFRGANNIADVSDRWTPSNPNPNAKYPKATSSLNVQWSNRFVEDASYLRLKNVQLSYTVPSEILPIRSARIFVSGQNLLTITNYSWYDPDVNAFESGDLRLGVDSNTFPVSRTFTFGVNIGL